MSGSWASCTDFVCFPTWTSHCWVSNYTRKHKSYYSAGDATRTRPQQPAWTELSATTQVLAPFLASACCVLQLLLNLLNAGCAKFNKVLGPVRPFFLGSLVAEMRSHKCCFDEHRWNCIWATTCGRLPKSGGRWFRPTRSVFPVSLALSRSKVFMSGTFASHERDTHSFCLLFCGKEPRSAPVKQCNVMLFEDQLLMCIP